MEAVYGMIGAMVGIALFIIGCFFGKTLYGMTYQQSPNTQQPVGLAADKDDTLTEEELTAIQEERKRLIEEQEAFRRLMNYNSDTAYGRVNQRVE